MTLNRVARWLAIGLTAGAAWIGLSTPAQAIPVFARQTGHNCQACHISYPELTAYGREFKLNGYTFGEAQPVPLALALMAEYTAPKDSTDHSTGGPLCDSIGAPCSKGQLTQYSIFYGGRITENLGVFGQASGGGFPLDSGGSCCNGLASDNTEIRYVHRFSTGASTEDDSLVGLLMNNNATMQDVWQSAPAWRFPWFPYNGVSFGPQAQLFLEGGGPSQIGDMSGHRVVGLGAYTWYQKNWYAEVTLYRAPWGGPFSFMDYGSGQAGDATQPSDTIKDWAPYYRAAYSRDWGYNSLEVGVFGMHASTYFDGNLRDPTQVQTFDDKGIDFQYQYNKGEPWVFGANASYFRETNNLGTLAAAGKATVSGHTINEFNLRGTAYWERKYGVTVGYQSITGTSDPLLYGSGSAGGSATGSPATTSYLFELNYLPMQDLRLSLFYQAFTKLNGGTGNFDGLGNNASGQSYYALAMWWIF
jgi:hypothetical protein